MQILVKTPSEGKLPEWSIIELQGDLHPHDPTDRKGAVIGDLYYTMKGEPLLIIGYHVLSGKTVKLDKPLAVMEKITTENNVDMHYEIRGLIRRKLIFSERPRPIVAKS